MTSNETIDAHRAAADAFNEWAGIGPGELPADPVDAMQVRLSRWQADRFAGVPSDDRILALGVIEELGEVFEADSAEDAIDGLGDVMIYGAQLCTANRLAIRPVVALACDLAAKDTRSPIRAAGALARVVVKHAQKIRGMGDPAVYRDALVAALAAVIAKAIEDCALAHELRIDPAGVFLVIGSEVLERKAGDSMIPASAAPAAAPAADPAVRARQLADARGKLREGVALLEIAQLVEGLGDFAAPTVTPQE